MTKRFGRRRAVALVTEFTGWPPPPPPPKIEPLLQEDELTEARAFLIGLALGCSMWVAILAACAWYWGLL